MRSTIPLSCFLILLVSCARYQYTTISSPNLSMNDNQQFVAENDTLKLIYNFNGRNGPIFIGIENKLDMPIYLDWRRSSLIVNDKAISYVPEFMSLSGSINTSGVNYNGRSTSYTTSTGTIDASIAVSPGVDFLPPHSYSVKKSIELTNRVVKRSDLKFHHVIVPSVDGGGYVTVRQATFTETSSPIKFRSYLTLMVGEADSKPVVYEHAFYVSELMTTGLKPSNFGDDYRGKGNRFYVKETTGYGKAMTGFGVIAGTAVIEGAAAALNPNSKCCNCQY